MPLVASRGALEMALVLDQRPMGARLSHLAEAGGLPLSSAQAAMAVLLDEGVAQRSKGTRPTYWLRLGATAEAVVRFAMSFLPAERVLTLIVRANPAVEFAGRDRHGLLLVLASYAQPRHVGALERALTTMRKEHRAPAVVAYDHDDLRDRLRDDPAPRRRARAARILTGSITRSFADRGRRHRRGRHLGKPHPELHRPSRRALAELARDHGLRRVALFGSSVRSDFGPDSDVDVLIEPRANSRLTLLDLAAVEERLERLFGRDVDVLTPGGLRDEIRQRVEREAVPLYG